MTRLRRFVRGMLVLAACAAVYDLTLVTFGGWIFQYAVQPSEVSMGMREAGLPAKDTLSIPNRSPYWLSIEEVQVSCECLHVGNLTRTVAPFSATEAPLSLNPGQNQGPMSQFVAMSATLQGIFTKRTKPIKVRTRCTFFAHTDPLNPTLRFGEVRPTADSEASRSIVLRPASGLQWTSITVASQTSSLQAKASVDVTQLNEGTKVTVSLRKDKFVGAFHEEVPLQLQGEGSAELIHLPVSGYYAWEWRSAPGMLLFTAPQKALRLRFTPDGGANTPPRLEDLKIATAGESGFAIAKAPGTSDAQMEYEVTWKGGGPHSGILTLNFKLDGKSKTLGVPFIIAPRTRA